MTCIVGLKDSGRIWMGGDSAGVANWDLQTRLDGKVFRNGPFIMGFTTSFRMGQLLRHSLAVPEHRDGQSVEAFMATTFIDAVRDCLKAGGFAAKTNDREDAGNFLVGYRDRLFEISSDYQVGENATGFAACGCGFAYALGSLSETDGLPPRERVMRALVCAERFSAGVRGPMNIIASDDAVPLALAAE